MHAANTPAPAPTIGGRISQRRRELQFPLDLMPSIVGLTTQEYADIEADRIAPGLEELGRIADALTVAPEFLIEAKIAPVDDPDKVAAPVVRTTEPEPAFEGSPPPPTLVNAAATMFVKATGPAPPVPARALAVWDGFAEYAVARNLSFVAVRSILKAVTAFEHTDLHAWNAARWERFHGALKTVYAAVAPEDVDRVPRPDDPALENRDG